jgi:hypothetical protein
MRGSLVGGHEGCLFWNVTLFKFVGKSNLAGEPATMYNVLYPSRRLFHIFFKCKQISHRECILKKGYTLWQLLFNGKLGNSVIKG